MLNPLTVSAYLLPPPIVPSIGLLADELESQVDPLGRLAEAAALVAKSRAALKKQSERFEKFYRQVARTATPEQLEETALLILDHERKLAAELAPKIEQLEQKLSRKRLPTNFARSLRRGTEEWLDIAQTWLELYQNLRIRLLKLASDRRAAAGETGSLILSDADEMRKYLRRIAGG